MDFAQDLEELVSTVFGPVTPDHAISEETIECAEGRLGAKLPSILRQYYHFAGRHPKVGDGMNHILQPDDLWMNNGGLVFEEESQRFYFSGILSEHLLELDPPVMQGNRDETQWYLQSGRLSDYLLSLICWQACNVLPAAHSRLPSPDHLEMLKTKLRWVSSNIDPNDDTIGLWGEGASAVVFTKGNEIYVAARTDELLKRFGRNWDLKLSLS